MDASVGTGRAVWFRRVAVVGLAGLCGLLTTGPSLAVTKFMLPAIGLMVWRSYVRAGNYNARFRGGRISDAQLSKTAYAIIATGICAILSLPLWILCDRALVAITLVPALICAWFAVYLTRGT